MDRRHQQKSEQGRQAREIKPTAIGFRSLLRSRLSVLIHLTPIRPIARRTLPDSSPRVNSSPVKTTTPRRHHRWSIRSWLPRLPIPRVIRTWLVVPGNRTLVGASLIIVLGLGCYVVVSHQLMAMRYHLLPSVAHAVGPADTVLLAKVHYDSKPAMFVLTAAKTPTTPRSSLSVGSSPTNPGYSFQLPSHLNQGISVTDPVSKLSIQLIPTTGASTGHQVDNHFVYPLAISGAQDIFTVKANGLQEDIALPGGLTHSLSFKYTLKLPTDLQARLSGDGTIGIYSAASALFGNISYGSPKDQLLVNTARNNGPKNTLVFALPAPVVEQANKPGFPSPPTRSVQVSYQLKGNQLTLAVHVSHAITGPIVIDPSIVVASASGFNTGNNEGDIAINTTNNTMSQAGLTGGSISAGWTATTVLPTATYFATSVAYNSYLYEIGGTPNGGAGIVTVDYAPINSNGTIGAWTATTSLPTGTYGATSVVYNGYVYEIGGYTTGATAAVDYAPINANGTLGAWTATTSLPTATYYLTSVAYNGYVYEIGGNGPTATVDYAPINSNGTLGAWTATTSLPTATSNVTSVAYNGYVYEIGGAAGGATATVDYAPINSNGTIGAWTATTSLPTATYSATSVAYNGYLYEIGGNTGSATTTVDYAPINANGTIGAWAATTSLPTATYMATSVAYNGYVYEIGGYTTAATATVDYAPIDPAGVVSGWSGTTGLPTATQNVTSVAYNGYVYEIGGSYPSTSSPQTFSYTGGSQTYTVPAGAISVNVTLYGGAGGGNGSGYGGAGGETTGTLTVTPGEVLTVIVAGAGALGNGSGNPAGGYGGANGGGGSGGSGGSGYSGAGGGGASQILNGATELAIAAGGGGPGPYGVGGSGGGFSGNTGGNNNNGPTGGGGGTQSAAGAGGAAGPSGNPGNAGVGSTGGSGASISAGYAGGGGGGGYYGGGGGGSGIYVTGSPGTSGGGGGGGGSSLVPAGGTTTSGVQSGVGSVVISYNFVAITATVDYAPINSNGTLGSWTSTTSLPTATQQATSVVYNGYLYEIGGNTGSATATVDYAPINSNGTLGSWTATTVLPTATYQATSVAYDGYLYEIGGNSAGVPITTVDYAPINTSGTIGSWTATTSLPTTTQQATSVAYNGYVYEIGNNNTATVDYAPINANGTLGAWTATTSLPTATYNATSIAYNGYVYEIGGYTTAATATVDYAPINSNGTLGSWTATTSLPTATQQATSVAYNGYVYEIGGYTTATVATVDVVQINNGGPGTTSSWTATTSLLSGIQYVNSAVYNGYVYEIGGISATGVASATVDYAPINTNGTLGSWTATTSLPTATEYITSVVYNGYLYEIGGYTTAYTATVDYAPINANGTLGSWTATTPLLVATDQATSVAYNGYVYEIGGANPSVAATVDYAPINANGTLGAWTATTSLPTATDQATSVAYNGYVYEIGGNSGTATVDYAPIEANGTIGAWTTTTSLLVATTYATSVAYNGYLYEMGGCLTGGCATAYAAVDYAPINANGTLGAWMATTSLLATTYAATSVAYNGYVYEIGGYTTTASATVDYAGLQSIPRIGEYSRLLDLTGSATNDPTPIELLTNGTNTGNPGIGGVSGLGTGGITVNSSFASNTCSTFSTPSSLITGNKNQLGTPFKLNFTTNGCGTATNIGRYVWVRYTIDDSQTATFPDINGNHTTINDFTVYYHPASGNRLRGGATFSNGSLQSLDAAP